MENKMVTILDEINKGATTGMNSISLISSKVGDNNFKDVLKSHYNKYKTISSKVNDIYPNYSASIPKTETPLMKAAVWSQVTFKDMSDNSVSNMSKILIEGTNMGIIKGRELLNDNENIASDVKDILSSFVSMQEENVETLKKYL